MSVDDPTATIDTWREHLVQAHQTASRDYDRTMTTLASGALGVSFIFIHDVAPHPQHVGVVVAAWCCFATTLLVVLASFLFSMMALNAAIDEADGRKPDRGCLSLVTTGLNWVAMVVLIGGVVCLVIFASLNVTT